MNAQMQFELNPGVTIIRPDNGEPKVKPEQGKPDLTTILHSKTHMEMRAKILADNIRDYDKVKAIVQSVPVERAYETLSGFMYGNYNLKGYNKRLEQANETSS